MVFLDLEKIELGRSILSQCFKWNINLNTFLTLFEEMRLYGCRRKSTLKEYCDLFFSS